MSESEVYCQDEQEYQGNIPTQPTPDDIYASHQQKERVENLVDQISPDHQLMDLQWRIKGYIKDPVSKMWVKINEKSPEINPILVSRYISYLSSILNQNTTLSNYSSDEINRIMSLLIKWIVDDLRCNAEEYGLGSNYSEWSRIGHIMLNTTFAAFKRAQNGMESKRIFKILNLNEAYSPVDQKKQGVMDALKFWK